MQLAGLPIDPLLKAVLTLAVPIVLYLVGAWLTAHQTQVNAATASIADERLRGIATDAVRWAEQAPEMTAKSGLEQRNAAAGLVASRLGIAPELAVIAVDAAYNGLASAGQINTVVLQPAPVAGSFATGGAAQAMTSTPMAPSPLPPAPLPPR